MSQRVDSASRLIRAAPDRIYRAFAEPGAMERWLPPAGMTGRMLHFDFREGGSYRMRLTYAEARQHAGKTSDDADEVEVRLIRLEARRRIEQEISFESENPAFSGVMTMVWTLRPEKSGTLVVVSAGNVPDGIDRDDHDAGLKSSLANLAAFVEAKE